MKGVAYLGNGRVEVTEYDRPVPGDGEVLVEIYAAGICGSDLHKYHMSIEAARSRNGMIAGHEGAGIVTALGNGVSGSEAPRIGDRVSIYHSLGCGRCVYCLAGTPVLCEKEGAFGRTRDGTHAEYVVAPAWCCLPLPAEHSFAAGAMLACTTGTAFAALEKARLDSGGSCVVFGLGPVGMTVLAMASAAGYRCVGIEKNRYRIAFMRDVFGCEVIDVADGDVVERIASWNNRYGVDGVIECSGSGAARRQAVECVAPQGTVVLVGVGDDSVPVSPERIIRKEITIRGNAVYSTSDYFRAMRFLERHRIDADRLISHRFSLSEAKEAFELFETGETAKVILERQG